MCPVSLSHVNTQFKAGCILQQEYRLLGVDARKIVNQALCDTPAKRGAQFSVIERLLRDVEIRLGDIKLAFCSTDLLLGDCV